MQQWPWAQRQYMPVMALGKIVMLVSILKATHVSRTCATAPVV